MHKKTEAVMRAALKPVGEELARLFVDSVILRINYRLVTAAHAGAEPEDVPEILQQNIDECAELVRVCLQEVSEVERAKIWTKSHGVDPKT
jgi:preprotein translocase subunit Sss1